MKKKIVLLGAMFVLGIGSFYIGKISSVNKYEEKKEVIKDNIVLNELETEKIKKEDKEQINQENKEIKKKNTEKEILEEQKNTEKDNKDEDIKKEEQFIPALKPTVKCDEGHVMYSKYIPEDAIPIKYLNGESVEFTHESMCKEEEKEEDVIFGGTLECGVCVKNSEYQINCPNKEHSKMAEGYGEY